MYYYKRHIGDYAKKAGRLSMLEHGAYTLLIDACYDRERFPTKDEAIKWCWARTADEIAAVEFVLMQFFDFDGERYTQGRIQSEIEKYHEKVNINTRIANNREEKRRAARERIVNEPCTDEHEPPPNHKPLTTNQEPITNRDDDANASLSASKLPDCPHQAIIDAYHEVLPECPRVKEWTDTRKRLMKSRWTEKAKDGKYKTQQEGVAYWKRFFAHVADSPFLTGRVQGRDGQAFIANLEWLIRPSNFAKVVEGNYHKD